MPRDGSNLDAAARKDGGEIFASAPAFARRRKVLCELGEYVIGS